MKTWISVAFGLCVLFVSVPVSAQQPPDVVRLHDGGMVRGTITEYVPDQYVVIVLPNGEERRFEGREVDFAGPGAELPAPAPPAPPRPPSVPVQAAPVQPVPVQIVGPPTVTVRFEAERPRTEIFRIVGAHRELHLSASSYGASAYVDERPVFERVCAAPCEAQLQPGVYGLGVSAGGPSAQPDDPMLYVAGPTSVRVGWIDRELLRIAGTIVALAGGILGGAGAIGGSVAFLQGDDVGWRDFAITASALFVVSLSVGLPLAFWGDTYQLTQDPPVPADVR